MNNATIREMVCDVAVVGGGPVGMVLALLLSHLGVKSVIFNYANDVRKHPKGNTHNSRTMEIYRKLGISKEVRDAGLPSHFSKDVMYVSRILSWEIARLDLSKHRQPFMNPTFAGLDDQVVEPLLRANQMYVEDVLYRNVHNSTNIISRFGWEVHSYEQQAQYVEIDAFCETNAHQERWRVQYLVGCDGAKSLVRRLLGFTYEGISEEQSDKRFLTGRMLSAYLRIPDLFSKYLGESSRVWMYNVMSLDARFVLVSLNGQDEFLMLAKPDNLSMENMDCSICELAQRGIGADIQVEVLSYGFWRGGSALVADRMIEGRVMLAGDSAHIFSPTGGFGMNTGIEDAFNLSWKIAALIKGFGGELLLGSYESERKPVAWRNVRAARTYTDRIASLDISNEIDKDDANGSMCRQRLGSVLSGFTDQFLSLGVELGAVYNKSPVLYPCGVHEQGSYFTYCPVLSPGCRMPNFYVNEDGVNKSIFDLFGDWFTLVDFGLKINHLQFVDSANSIGVPLKVLHIEDPNAIKFYGKCAVLVRPDLYVGWVCDESSGVVSASEVLKFLCGVSLEKEGVCSA